MKTKINIKQKALEIALITGVVLLATYLAIALAFIFDVYP